MYGDEMGYAIQEVFEETYHRYLAAYSAYPDSNKVAQAILKCMAPLMGGKPGNLPRLRYIPYPLQFLP